MNFARHNKGLMLSLFMALTCFYARGQELNVPVADHIPKKWDATWVTHPELSGNEYAVVLFRKSFELKEAPRHFILSLSGDNKYRFFVNGQEVCFGPQLSDVRHWRYETIDIGKFLKAGKNCVAAEVLNFGPNRFFGQQSYRTAFILNGIEASPDRGVTSLLNTRQGNGWKTFRNTAINEKPVRWRSGTRDIIGGFYAANPTDSILCNLYPWGWEEPGFPDKDWLPAQFSESASAFGGGFGWLLEPRNTPLQVQHRERLSSVLSASGIKAGNSFLSGTAPLKIPANSKVTLLIDHTFLTIGYPELLFSGGKDAEIRVGYAENLFLASSAEKGNRNEWKGKRFVGITDVIIPDGGTKRLFRPTWLRTFRFVRIEVTTKDAPLILEDFYNRYTTTPVPVKATFTSSSPVYNKIAGICQRTVQLCTQDYFLSDAYYETMQYVGDTKVHALVWQALTGDGMHTRNALSQFHYSRLWDGNLTSCYPLRSTFVHPTYSVIWIDMLLDYLRFSNDSSFIRSMVPGIHQTLAMFEELIQPNGLAGKTRWNYFVDWYADSNVGGLAPGQDGSNSAVVTLHYVYALQNAATLLQYLGEEEAAGKYRRRADEIKKKVSILCYDRQRKMFSERPDHSYYDQHTNIMAVLTDAVPTDEQGPLLERILNDSTLGQATYYYRFYLFEAMKKAKATRLFDKAQKPWEKLIENGLTTTLERFESTNKPTRSECHPWSTAPLYAYYTLIAGIRPVGIGLSEVVIEPDLGVLQFVAGSYPHPAGLITFRFEKTPAGIKGFVNLPMGLSGTLKINNTSASLKAGTEFKF